MLDARLSRVLERRIVGGRAARESSHRRELMSTQRQILDYYTRPGPMTSAGKYSAMLKEPPADVAALGSLVQGLAIHEYIAKSFYGVVVPDVRKCESHIRPVEQMLDRL